MENPLTEEHIKKINDIAKLPPDKQQLELQNLLKTLSPEQIEFLKKQQGQSCIFCSISEGQVESKKVFEDDRALIVLDINPANPGHLLVFPRKHAQAMRELNNDEVSYLFVLANKASNVLIEKLKAEGTNIFVANGFVAGQNAPHVLVHVIPRFKEDGIALFWKGKKVNDAALEEIKRNLVGTINKEEKIIKQKEADVFDYDANEEYRLP